MNRRYEVRVGKRVERELGKLPRRVALQIAEAILELADNPRPQGSKKLRDQPVWRIRVGDFRVLYDIDDKQRIVTVERAGHRREIYRGR